VISYGVLVRGHTIEGESCVIDGVGPVPVSTVRAMTADAFLAAVVTNGCDIRSVAHAGRQVTARQRNALLVRDPHCVVPGCAVSTGLEIDHVTRWPSSRVTTLQQLAPVRRHHHRQEDLRGLPALRSARREAKPTLSGRWVPEGLLPATIRPSPMALFPPAKVVVRASRRVSGDQLEPSGWGPKRRGVACWRGAEPATAVVVDDRSTL